MYETKQCKEYISRILNVSDRRRKQLNTVDNRNKTHDNCVHKNTIQCVPWVPIDNAREIDLETGKLRDLKTHNHIKSSYRGGLNLADFKAATLNPNGIGSLYFEKTGIFGTRKQKRIRLVHPNGPELSRTHKNVKWKLVAGSNSHSIHLKEFEFKNGILRRFHTSRGVPIPINNMTQAGIKALARTAAVSSTLSKNNGNQLIYLVMHRQIALGQMPNLLDQSRVINFISHG